MNNRSASNYFIAPYIVRAALQAGRPQDIILDADTATDPEKANPEFEAEVRLLCEAQTPGFSMSVKVVKMV